MTRFPPRAKPQPPFLGLLIERGTVVDRLIEIKSRQGGSSAFRPAREASIMRAIVERHRGLLPLDTVEAIWRIIISTFTYVQSPYTVHIDVSGGEAPMRDSMRFHFGFTVPCEIHHNSGEVIDAVAGSRCDLGMFALERGPGVGAWWTALVPLDTPKVIARLPFVERPDHPIGMPVFVLSNPIGEGCARDIVLESVMLDRWQSDIPQVLGAIGAEVIDAAADTAGLTLLVARPGASVSGAVRIALQSTGFVDVRTAEIGSHTRQFSQRPDARNSG